MQASNNIATDDPKNTIEVLRERIKYVYPNLYDAACSPYIKNITHGKRISSDCVVIDQFFMHFDNTDDQVMWNLMFSDSSNYDLK